MKISGYEIGDLPIEDIKFIDLAEITFVATPDELRKIAKFLNSAAQDMEKMGKSYDHVHLSDNQPGFKDSPHLTVFNTYNVE